MNALYIRAEISESSEARTDEECFCFVRMVTLSWLHLYTMKTVYKEDDMGKYSSLAADIIKNVGGKENVESLRHCVTRLRFRLIDESIAMMRSSKIWTVW